VNPCLELLSRYRDARPRAVAERLPPPEACLFGAVHGLWCCYGYGHETPPGRWRWRSCVVGGLYVCCCGGRARWWSVSLGVLTVMLGLLPVGVIVAVGFLV